MVMKVVPCAASSEEGCGKLLVTSLDYLFLFVFFLFFVCFLNKKELDKETPMRVLSIIKLTC